MKTTTTNKTMPNKPNINGSTYGCANASEAIQILDACRIARMPVMLVGDPGVGKTAMINAWCRDNHLGEPILLIGSQMEPQDVAGLPMSGEMEYDGRRVPVTEYGSPSWQVKILTGQSKVIFMDEFSNSPAAIQSGLLKLVGDRTFGNGEKLPDDTMIVMAMNPEDTAVDYTPIAAPMANRICWISYKPSDSEVYEGLAGGWFTAEQRDAWSESETNWRNRIVSFLRSTGGAYILDFDRVGDDLASRESTSAAYDMANSSSELEIGRSAWASPRSWDNLARVLGAFGEPNRRMSPIQLRVARGIVGMKCATKLGEYVERNHDLDPFDIIMHPSKQNWKVSANNTYDDINRIAGSVNEAILKCDGEDGRPNAQDAMGFYEKVLELGGAPYFISAITSGGEQSAFLRGNKPVDIPNNEWTKRFAQLLIGYKNADLIPEAQKRTA